MGKDSVEDETRLFDKEYFREMMLESRERAKKKREEIRKLLADSRSGALTLLEDPDFNGLPGFFNDLDDFIRSGAEEGCSGYSGLFQQGISTFQMDRYLMRELKHSTYRQHKNLMAKPYWTRSKQPGGYHSFHPNTGYGNRSRLRY